MSILHSLDFLYHVTLLLFNSKKTSILNVGIGSLSHTCEKKKTLLVGSFFLFCLNRGNPNPIMTGLQSRDEIKRIFFFKLPPPPSPPTINNGQMTKNYILKKKKIKWMGGLVFKLHKKIPKSYFFFKCNHNGSLKPNNAFYFFIFCQNLNIIISEPQKLLFGHTIGIRDRFPFVPNLDKQTETHEPKKKKS